MLLVQCPHCKNRMKTNPKDPSKASKKCVYCGKTFKIHSPGGNSQIVG
jgi:ribosomal protein S27E